MLQVLYRRSLTRIIHHFGVSLKQEKSIVCCFFVAALLRKHVLKCLSWKSASCDVTKVSVFFSIPCQVLVLLSLTALVISSVDGLTLVLAGSKKKRNVSPEAERKGAKYAVFWGSMFYFDNESCEAALPRSGMTNKALEMRTIRDY